VKNALFTLKGHNVRSLQRQRRAQIPDTAGQALHIYFAYIPVLDFGFLRLPTSCIHAVVRAMLLCPHENNTIFRTPYTALRVQGVLNG